jgi:hypothetical protein
LAGWFFARVLGESGILKTNPAKYDAYPALPQDCPWANRNALPGHAVGTISD